MKKLCFSLAIMFFFSTVLFADTATTIRITNGEWEPFLSEYCPHYGVDSHIVSEAFKLEGITIKWGFFPWKRAFVIAEQAEDWDASAAWWPTDEVKQGFLVSDPISNTSFVFFHIKNYQFDWKSIDDLKGIKIGGTLGYDYGKDFMKAMEENRIQVDTVPADETNFKKLLKDRIQIFPNDPIVGYSQIRNTFSAEEAAQFTHHPKEFEKSTLHLIISKKCKNGQLFLDKFNSGLKKLKESGRFDQIFKDLEAGKYDKQKEKWKE